MDADLERCPFCAETIWLEVKRLSLEVEWYVKCSQCDAYGPLGKNVQEAIKLWNHRPSSA